MAGLINKISLQWDLWIGQFRAFYPKDKEERQDCRLLLEALALDPNIKKAGTQLVACQDSRNGDIIACLKLEEAPLNTDADPSFALVNKDRLSKMVIFTQLAIKAGYHKTSAPMVLMNHCFLEVLKAGGQAVLMSCDPDYFSMYKRLGFRPIGPLHKNEEGEFRIPMICMPDQDYLSIIHSPTLPLLKGVDFRHYTGLCQWYYQLVRDNRELQIGSAFYPENEEAFEGHQTLTEGLSEQGKEAFLKNAMVINCREGESLIIKNDGGKAFGFVQRGIVKVVIGGKSVVLLGEGDIFGEIAYILNARRSAEVMAASPDTEVVLFSQSAINSLALESDRTVIWRNLARVLAQRVVLTNKLLV
ncbi:MAG: hypothetical protein DHS20C18_28790 [Saprospiraceae bacterium]|nr:MAG: hypothetical protein DHS20C18_28790 [Saprospiraceae bacterium]